MKVLVEVRSSPVKRYFVKLSDQDIIDDVKEFINNGNYQKAIDETLMKGELISKITEDEIRWLDPVLILRQKSAHWDLT